MISSYVHSYSQRVIFTNYFVYSLRRQIGSQLSAIAGNFFQQGQGQKPDTQSQDEENDFWSCYQRNQFSSLFADTRFHSAIKVIEIGSDISFFGDVAATIYKASSKKIGQPQAYASGMNWVFRRISTGTLRGTLTSFGNKATPVLAVTAVFTLSYNATIAAQCKLGVLK